MRRSILASVPSRLAFATVAALASFALTACEDGPTQTYSPAPPNAGNYLNGDRDAGAVVDPATKNFITQQTGTNKQELCDAPTQQKVLAKAFAQPVIPPGKAAGIDVTGGSSWQGLTVEQAETPVWDANHQNVISGLCQGTAQGDLFNDGTQAISWGDGPDLLMDYRVSDRKALFMEVLPGYTGSMTAKSRDGAHTYQVPIYSTMLKDGAPFVINWNAPKQPGDWRNEVHDALLATFAPGLPPSSDCSADGRCIQGSFGDVGYLFIPAIGSGIWTLSQMTTPNVMFRIDIQVAKVVPFAFAAPLLKIDQQGPIASAGLLGKSQTPCTLQLGLKYSDFLSQCIQVSGDATTDQSELNKLLGGLTHNTERFHFDITGVDVNFTNNHLAADKVTTDKDRPQGDDTSTSFTVDQSALGKIANDYVNNDSTQALDRHGSGWLYFDFARSVQEQLNALTGGTHPLGDPACTSGQTDDQLSALGCTGFEGFMTQAPAAGIADPNMARVAKGIAGKTSFGLTGLKPGHHLATFCNDVTAADTSSCGGKDANGKPSSGISGDVFSTSFARVLKILGKGKVATLPLEVQDVRFFFKTWFVSLIKYLKNAQNLTLDSETLHSTTYNTLGLYFDSIGNAQFEIAEYIERSVTDATHVPLDIVFTADVKNGIMNDYSFSGDLFRGEEALYTAMIDHRKADDPPGKQDTALLTNIFGSPVLATSWQDHTTDATGGPKYTAFYCATQALASVQSDKDGCKGQTAPLDAKGNILLGDNGLPLLAPYEGALGSNKSVFALGPTTISIVSTDLNILSAMIRIPLHSNPYDLSSAPPSMGASLQVLVPWAPKSPLVGFPVALDGTRDKFIESYQLDLGGTQVTANIDYDFQIDANTHQPLPAIQFEAVETTDFLGDVFVCQDPQTKDLLTARMYTSVATILDWFASHPGAYQACGMIVRYSPYGNFADYITSLINGVRLGVTQGGGYGRIVDGTLFTPGQ